MAGAGEQPTTKAELLSVVQDLIFKTNQGNGKNNFIQTNDSLWSIFTYLINFLDTSVAGTALTVTSYPDAQPTVGNMIGDLYVGDTTRSVWDGDSWIPLQSNFTLNTLTGDTQTFAVGTSGTDFGINSSGTVHTFNIPTASASNRGLLSAANWTTFNSKQAAITTGTIAQYFRGDLSLATFPTALSSFSNDSGYITASSASALTNKTGNISQWTNDSGYITTTGITPAALTKTDDTNVTLTLGGTPTTSLLQATSLTLGWTGTLADGRIASAATWNAKESALTFNNGVTRSVNTVSIDYTRTGNVYTGNGLVSSPLFSFTGVPYTGGTSTTTKPFVLLEPSGTTSTSWSTSGTMFGINAASGFTGNIFDFKANNTTYLKLTAAGVLQDNTGLFVISSGNGTFQNLSVGNTGYVSFASSTILTAATNSTLLLTNAAANDFGRIMLGGTTSSFPSIGRNGNNITIKLADNSAFAPIEALRYLTTTNAVVSFPQFYGSGTWYSGGTSTTTKPYLLLEPSGTTSTNWSTSGTGIGINAASGFVGNLLDLQLNNTSKFLIKSTGVISNTSGASGGSALMISRDASLNAVFGIGEFVGNPYGSACLAVNGNSSNFSFWAGNTAVLTVTKTSSTISTIQIGGTTSSFAMFKGTSAILEAKLADDSGYTTFEASRYLNSTNGIVSNANIYSSGTWYSGGSSTTTKPTWLIEPTGTTSNAWSGNGTGFGINAASGFTGNIFDYKINSTLLLKLDYAGLLTGVSALFSGNLTVANLPYDATTWNGNTTVPTRDDIRDKIETMTILYSGSHRNLSISYVAALDTPTSGTNNTVMDVKTITLPANTCVRVGDRLKIHAGIAGNTASPILGTLKLNGVTLDSVYVSSSSFQTMLIELEYVDATHANIIGSTTSIWLFQIQTASFNWAAAQDIVVSQNNVSSTHIDVYSLVVDVLPITV